MLLPSQRHFFEIPADVVYMNCAYMSALPKATIAAGEQALRRKGRPWTIASQDFFTDSEAVRALFARLINARSDDVALVPAVSYGMAQAANNIPVTAKQKILTLAEEFPSNVYPWADLAERVGATMVAVPRPNDGNWTAALLAHGCHCHSAALPLDGWRAARSRSGWLRVPSNRRCVLH